MRQSERFLVFLATLLASGSSAAETPAPTPRVSVAPAATSEIGRRPQAIERDWKFGTAVAQDTEVLQSFGAASYAWLPEPFRVLVWNVYKNQRAGFNTDFEVLSRRADLVLMQEAFLDEKGQRAFVQSPGREWVMASSFYNPEGLPTGVATGGVVSARYRRFVRSDAREPFTETPKMALLTTYRLKDRAEPLLVVNVHAINFVSVWEFDSHLGQIDQAMRGHEGPMILAGDFNTWAPARFESLSRLAAKYGLNSVDFDGDSRFLVLDHAFIRGLKVKTAQVLWQVNSSDHKPLVFEVETAR